eukprot:CAMPEP_0116543182 /NCGR_PEP_ID=MMETSP0397-20121206/1420_1 /TAXON_ID=216820 /ORGANISM="Cyclophora tenuis, Strain ECT3854" /LENGTH=89 /DNA_ID=CAMNT_0004067255 /DNA_START=501 /DNA_END=770 /DNA_ORIENTATION=+
MTLHWRTTPYNREHKIDHKHRFADKYMCEEHPTSCFDIGGWTKKANPSMFWDKFYMYEPMYRGINEDLLVRMGYPITNPINRSEYTING